MVQSDIDPCIYYKIMENAGDEANNAVSAFLVVISWVDDCRYFGTPELVAEYENLITSNCKCTMEGISKEFVSIQMNHDLDKKTFELTQEEYWEKGVKRFKDFIGERGPKIRLVPLSPADEKLLVEPTAEEIAKLDKAASGAFEIGFAFNHWTLGEECMQRLGFIPEEYNSPKEWRKANHKQFKKYRGEWVAFTKNGVIAHHPKFDGMINSIEDKTVDYVIERIYETEFMEPIKFYPFSIFLSLSLFIWQVAIH